MMKSRLDRSSVSIITLEQNKTVKKLGVNQKENNNIKVG